jgi:hypothetical protein
MKADRDRAAAWREQAQVSQKQLADQCEPEPNYVVVEVAALDGVTSYSPRGERLLPDGSRIRMMAACEVRRPAAVNGGPRRAARGRPEADRRPGGRGPGNVDGLLWKEAGGLEQPALWKGRVFLCARLIRVRLLNADTSERRVNAPKVHHMHLSCALTFRRDPESGSTRLSTS